MPVSAGKKIKASANKSPVEKYLCHFCGSVKRKDEFYACSDPRVITGITRLCKECVTKIALNYDPYTGKYGTPTKGSIMEALEYIDRPFLENIYEASYVEWSSGSAESRFQNIWSAYIKNISMPRWKGLRWRDSDMFARFVEDAKERAVMELHQEGEMPDEVGDAEVTNEFERNKRDVIRLLGYDPFGAEPPSAQPLLYSQLLGYLDQDGDGTEDMMRISSAITIVRGFLQQSLIDDKIAMAMSNSQINATELKQLLDSKKNVSSTITLLAEQSCLSLKHNKNASKGDGTWTGKIKKLKELNLRDGEVNGFDIGTCRGMRQVMDMSNASILKQLRLDESEYSDMLAQQRELVTSMTDERDKYKEVSRILLRENLDLRDILEQNDLIKAESLVNLKDLYSVFGSVSVDTEDDIDIEDGDIDE